VPVCEPGQNPDPDTDGTGADPDGTGGLDGSLYRLWDMPESLIALARLDPENWLTVEDDWDSDLDDLGWSGSGSGGVYRSPSYSFAPDGAWSVAGEAPVNGASGASGGSLLDLFGDVVGSAVGLFLGSRPGALGNLISAGTTAGDLARAAQIGAHHGEIMGDHLQTGFEEYLDGSLDAEAFANTMNGASQNFVMDLIGEIPIAGPIVRFIALGSRNSDVVFEIAANGARLRGSAHGDRFVFGADAQRFEGGAGRDALFGRGGHDTLSGGSWRDFLSGGAGNDRLWGGTAADAVLGNTGHDILRGGSGNDDLRGGSGRDTLYGDRGGDRIVGGPGNDILSGGSGQDRFVFKGNSGNDRIRDFNPERDLLLLDLVRGPNHVTDDFSQFVRRVGEDTLVTHFGGTILVRDVLPADLLPAFRVLSDFEG
jgi:Ca2+-binding RTX toxin-like protein